MITYRNLAHLHRLQSERLGNRIALRWKQDGLYHDLSWNRYHEQVTACAAALIDVGINVGDRVGLFAENRYEWLIADVGILSAGAVNVTPHAPLTPAQVQYELADAEVSWLFVSTATQRDKILEIQDQLPLLKGIVVFDPDAATKDVASWRGFLQRGRRHLTQAPNELLEREQQLSVDSLATIMYTSGTTGQPKGVMLTHGNLLSNTLAVLEVFDCEPSDVLLSWLPYSHIYARTCDHYCSIGAGLPLCLAESAETLIFNLAEVQPTRMTAVPRFYEKVLSFVWDEDPEVRARRLKAVLGPRLDYLSSGGAPLPPSVAKFYHEAGLLLLQGYGLTESSPVISFNRKSDYKVETVGKPIPGVEVRIGEDGEVLTRGPHVMKGYWKQPEITAETIEDGWLKTGDLGSLDEDGFLSITGRKKELMVLSNGKKVVPSHLENLIVTDPHVAQIVIVGEARNYLTALVVPNWEQVKQSLGSSESEEALSQSEEVVTLLLAKINAQLTNVANWEQVKKIYVQPRPFTVEAEELTVSLKLRRGVILKRYAEEIEQLYSTSK